MKKGILALFICGVLFSMSALGDNCSEAYKDLKKGDYCKAGLFELRPTQFTVGMIEVRQKIKEEILGKSYDEIVEFEKQNREPIVVGPNGTLFITDHHHLARALLDSKRIADTHCEVVANWSDLSWSDFWTRMNANHFFFLGELGVMHPPSWVNRYSSMTVADLRDDPYRSLAGYVEKAGGYDKKRAKQQYFEEFLWADYFRDKVPVNLISSNFKQAVLRGVDLAHDPAARNLPGYIPR